MPEPVTITVAYDVGRLSPNHRLHWRARHERASAARLTARFAWHEAGCPIAHEPVIVDIILRRGRKMDADNALAACKALIDGLFQGRITPDDNPNWLEVGTLTQVVGRQWRGREQVSFVVRPREVSL